MNRWSGCCFSVLILVVSGCSDKHPVTGTVLFTDGKPVPFVTVIFTSEDGIRGGVARTDEDGTYEVSYESVGDGLPAGEYLVSVLPPDPMNLNAEQSKQSPGPGWGIGRKYMSSGSSGIRVTVDSKQDVVIELEKTLHRGRKDNLRAELAAMAGDEE